MKSETEIRERLDYINGKLKRVREWKALNDGDINNKAYRLRGLSIEKTTLQIVLDD